MKPSPKRSSRPAATAAAGDVLAFGAHPDDIEFGCGGIIARETQAGGQAHFVVCSRGESASHGTPASREREARRAAELLGATVEFLPLDGDAQLEHRPAHSRALAAVIRRLRPRTILAPSIADNQHPDHARLGRIVRDAARLARFGGVKELRGQAAFATERLLYYAITAEAEPPGAQPVLIDVSLPAVLTAWKAAMRAHASQARSNRYVALQLSRARTYGLRAGVAYAQPLFPNDPLIFSTLSALGAGARRF